MLLGTSDFSVINDTQDYSQPEFTIQFGYTFPATYQFSFIQKQKFAL